MNFRKLVCDAARFGFSARDALRAAVALDASGEIVTGMSGSSSGVTTGAMPAGSTSGAGGMSVSQPSGSTSANATGYNGQDEGN